MRSLSQSKLEINLIYTREKLLEKLLELFKERAVESHILGSIARQQADAYSDIDIWFTFNDEDFEEIYNKRFEYYRKIGNVIHSCEAPQNAPLNGVNTFLLIQFPNNIIVVVDIYLCPLSTAYTTEEGRKLFGIDLPLGTTDFNSKKVNVDKDYRIDFFMGFIFNAIKKLARREQDPFESLFREYEYLHKNYDIEVEQLDSKKQTVSTLERVIENIQKVANDKQKKTLAVIGDFARKVLR